MLCRLKKTHNRKAPKQKGPKLNFGTLFETISLPKSKMGLLFMRPEVNVSIEVPNGTLEQWVVSMDGCIRDGKFDRTSDTMNKKKS